MFALIALQQNDGLTLSEVIRDLPHDGPALVVYAMLVVCIGLIWAGSRKRTP